MNTSYRLVWSVSRQAYVVAHENAKARGKAGSARAVLAILGAALLGVAPVSWASCSVTDGTTLASTCTMNNTSNLLVVEPAGSIITDGESAVISDASVAVGDITSTTIINEGRVEATGASALVIKAGQGNSHDVNYILSKSGATIKSTGGHAIDLQGNNAPLTIGLIQNVGTIEASGNYASAVKMSGDVTVNGSFTNNGQIISDDIHTATINIEGGKLGEFHNMANGVVKNTSGMAFDLSQNARIEGSFLNDGSITAGEGMPVVYIRDGASIGGGFFNNGTISNGSNPYEVAVQVRGSTITGILLNSQGALIEGGEGAISIDDSTVGGIENQGQLIGGNAGITVNYSTINGDLLNGGTLSSDSHGIELYESTVNGNVTNSGTLTSGTDAIRIHDNTKINGNVTNSGTITAYDGIDIDGATVTGSILNTGLITAENDGFELEELLLSGDIINQGTIIAGDWGINIDNSTITGSVLNEGLINSAGAGLTLEDSTAGVINNSGIIESSADNGVVFSNSTATRLDNSGLISGLIGIDGSSGSLGAINNQGTIAGQTFAIRLSDDMNVANINILGSTARVLGDVKAINSAFNLKTGAVFTNTNAFDVYAFNIKEGATLNMGAGLSTSKTSGEDLALIKDGITVGMGGFNNSGTLALGATSVGTIHGDYRQTGAGVLQVGVASNTSFGKLVVDGTANLDSKAKINVDVANPNYKFSVSQLANVITANHLISDGTFAVTDNSLLFDFGAVKDGNTVDLTLRSNSAPDTPNVQQIVHKLGNTPGSGAAQALGQSFANNPTGELASHFVGLTTEQQVSDAVTQSLPLLTGSSIGATSNTLSGINRVIQARQEGNSGLSSGETPLAENNLWIKAFGSWADQSTRSGVSGFDANTEGLAIGADAAVSEQARLGMAFAYAKTSVDSDSSIAPQDSQIDTFQLIGYGSYALAPDTELNFQVDAGKNNNQGKRHMPFADATAKADYTSYSAHAGVGLGHTLRFTDTFSFVPSVRADYTWIGDEAYNEKGAGALNLNVDKRDAEELILGVDGKLNYHLSDSTLLSANLGAGYDVINEASAITSTYAGSPGAAFTTRGLNPSPWLGRAGLGLSHTLNNGTEISVRYDAESRSDFLNQGASVKARWAF